MKRHPALSLLTLLSALMLGACSPKTTRTADIGVETGDPYALPGEVPTKEPGLEHVVRVGDSWYSLALDYYGDAGRARGLRRANRMKIEFPQPGTELFVPMDPDEQAAFAERRRARAPYNRGLERARAGDYPDAILAFQEALRLDPVLARAHYNLGLVYRRSGRPSLAAASLARACELNRRDADYLYAWGQALAELREPRAAEKRYREALKADPEHLASLYALARALDARGRRREAARFWRELWVLAPASLRGQEAARRLGLEP